MPSCNKCHEPVISGPVLHSECLDSLKAERDFYKKSIKNIAKLGKYPAFLASEAIKAGETMFGEGRNG